MQVSIAIATVLFFGLAWQKYRNFQGDSHDIAVYSYAFEQVFEGKFLPLYYLPGSLLGNHLNFIVLLWLPIYAVWRSFYSLLFFQSLMLAISAWPFYLIARHVLRDQLLAWLAGLAFLVFPTIASQHVNQLHDDQFALPFFMFAFYYFLREDFRRFVVFLVLATLAKETIVITTAAFGVYALLLRRRAVWIVVPIVWSAAYLALALTLLTRVFPGAGAVIYTGTTYFEAFGHSPAEALRTMLSRPDRVLQVMFAPEKLAYLRRLFLPLLFALPFLSLSVMIALPNLLLNLLSSNSALIVIPWHYNILLGAALLTASLFGVQRVGSWFGARQTLVQRALLGAIVALSVFGMRFWFRAAEYQSHPYRQTLLRALELTPRDAAVLCPTPMLAHFSNRKTCNTAYGLLWWTKDPARLADYDWVLIDGNWRAVDAAGQQPLVDMIQKSGNYQVVFVENNVALLRRTR